jgi:hypothetical protein
MLSYTNDQSRYTSEVQQWHRDVGPQIPIGDFVNYLDPEVLGLENAAQFYAPVEFSIHVKGHISEPAGAIRLHVPVHANENWLSILKEHIGTMYHVGAQYIDLRDVAGRSVTVFDKDQLENVGKLSVYVDGRKARLDTMPQVPAEYSINKLNSIEAWYNAVKADLPEIAAKELVKCSSVDELIEAIAPGGSVESVIKSELHERTSDWNEFVRVNRMNSPYSLSSAGATQALDAIGETVRGELDAFVRSAPQQISSYFSSIQAERMQRKLYQEGRDVDGYKQLFNAMPAHIKVSSENGFQMFHDFASNVFDSPTVAEDITNVIYLKPIAGCRWETDPETKNFDDGRSQNNQNVMKEKKSKPKTGGYSADIVKPVQPESRLKLFTRFTKSYKKLSDEEKQRIRNVTHAISNTPLAAVNAKNMYNFYISEMRVSLDGSEFQRTQSEISNNLIGFDFNFWGSRQKNLTLQANYKDLVNVGYFYRINLQIRKGSKITKEQMRYLISMLAERLEFIVKGNKSQLRDAYFGSEAFVPKEMLLVKPTDRTAAVPKQGSKEEDNFYQGNDNIKVLSTDDTVYAALKQSEKSWRPYVESARFFEAGFRKIIDKSSFTSKSVAEYSALVSNTQYKKGWYDFGVYKFGSSASYLKPLALLIFGYEYKNERNMTDADVQAIFYKLMRQVHRAHRSSSAHVFQTALSKFEQREKELAQSAKKQQPKNIPGASKTSANDSESFVEKAKRWLEEEKKSDPKFYKAFSKLENAGATTLSNAITEVLQGKFNYETRLGYLKLLGYKAHVNIEDYVVDMRALLQALVAPDGPTGDNKVDGLAQFIEDALYNLYLDKASDESSTDSSYSDAASEKDTLEYESTDQSEATNNSSYSNEEEEDLKNRRTDYDSRSGEDNNGSSTQSSSSTEEDEEEEQEVPSDSEKDSGNSVPGAGTVDFSSIKNDVDKDKKFMGEEIKNRNLTDVVNYIELRGKQAFKRSFTNDGLKTLISHLGLQVPKTRGLGQKKVIQKDLINVLLAAAGYKMTKNSIEAHHPWNAHIQKLKDISGSYPDHYIENHNKMDLSEHAPYEGDAEETYEAYHMFAGAAVMPEAAFISRHRCMDKHKKKKKSRKRPPLVNASVAMQMRERHSIREEEIRERPPLVNASVAMQMRERHSIREEEIRERPPLVNASVAMQMRERHSIREEDIRERPPLVNASVAMQMRERPPLVPINAPIREEEMRERPPLVPINAPIREEEMRERPPLVSASVAMQMRERNVKVEKIESPSRFAGLPSVDDLF